MVNWEVKMKRLYTTLLILTAFVVQVYAAIPTRSYTYSSGDTIDPDEVTTNEDNLYNYLSAGVEAIAANTVVSADIVDATIVAADLASNSVTNAKMADDSVTTDEIVSL